MKSVKESRSSIKFSTAAVVAISVPSLALLVACGDMSVESQSATDTATQVEVEMPDVVSSRLDVAISDLEALGVDENDVEIVGGGSFGVIDESNWTVCEQRPEAGEASLENVRLIVDRECPERATNASSDFQDTERADAGSEGDPSGTEDAGGETAEPDSPVEFLSRARGDLRDMRKDLNDMEEALAEGGFLRVAGNVLELSFNIGQLQSLNPPVEVAEGWTAALGALEGEVDRLGDLISDDGTPKQVNKALRDSRDAIRDAIAVLDDYEENLD